jgi:Flp pilus assembly protein TadD
MQRIPLVLFLSTLGLSLAPNPGAAADDRDYEQAVKHVQAGQKALTSERWDEAEEEFRIATELDPLLVGGHYGLGQTYMATKRYPEAVRAYEQAETAFHEQQAEGLTDGLALQKRLDDQIKALQDDNNTARLRVSGPNADAIDRAITRNEEQIRTLQGLKNRDPNEALPTPHWLSLALGSAHFRNQHLRLAEQAYLAAVDVKPDLAEAHLNLSVVYMLTNRLEQAEQEVKLAEEAGLSVPQGLKDDIARRKAGGS